MALIDAGEEVSEGSYVSLFYNEFDVLYEWGLDEMSEEERAIVEKERAPIEEDFFLRWDLSDEEYQELCEKAEKNYHVLSYSDAEKFVKKWLKGRE